MYGTCFALLITAAETTVCRKHPIKGLCPLAKFCVEKCRFGEKLIKYAAYYLGVSEMNKRSNTYSLLIMVAIISFLGYNLENIWLAVTKGFIDNRNMSFPFLLGYGLFVVGLYLVAGTPKSPGLILTEKRNHRRALYFFVSMIIISVGEIILGFTVEKFFGFEYWNYTALPLHITKYTSIPTSIGFSFLLTLFMDKFFEPLLTQIDRIPRGKAKIIGIILAVIMVVDFIASFVNMYITRSANIKWKKTLKRSGEVGKLLVRFFA